MEVVLALELMKELVLVQRMELELLLALEWGHELVGWSWRRCWSGA
jgi:hypothetical protein